MFCSRFWIFQILRSSAWACLWNSWRSPLVNRGNWQAVIGNEDFFVELACFSLRTIRESQAVNFEVCKNFADFRRVIKRKQESALKHLEQVCKLNVVVFC